MEEGFERCRPDMETPHHKFRTQRSVCRLVEGDPDLPLHVVHEDDETIASLDGYPGAYDDYTLVAPFDLTVRDFLELAGASGA
jgi:diadenosine tetraphosphate (Ap4A) HIT family hydrolase